MLEVSKTHAQYTCKRAHVTRRSRCRAHACSGIYAENAYTHIYTPSDRIDLWVFFKYLFNIKIVSIHNYM